MRDKDIDVKKGEEEKISRKKRGVKRDKEKSDK